MATIALYESKINSMPSLIKEVKNSVGNLKSELNSFINKCSKINRNICDLDDVISSISSSTQTQEQKEASLKSFSKSIETFADEVDKIDSNVADMINESKDDFYDKYYYLKPEVKRTGGKSFATAVILLLIGVKNTGNLLLLWCWLLLL